MAMSRIVETLRVILKTKKSTKLKTSQQIFKNDFYLMKMETQNS